MWVQQPDLTEEYCASWSTNFPKLATEFAFCTATPLTTPVQKDSLVKLGFKCVSSMNNWFHYPERRRIDLYWYKSPKPQAKPCALSECHFGTYKRVLQATGCGFALGSKLQHEHYWRFHTLMRMPIKPSPKQLLWLERCHYQKIDEGTLSSYWVNGFDPAKYTWKLEEEYWQSLKLTFDGTKSITPLRTKRVKAAEQKAYQEQMKAYNARYNPQYAQAIYGGINK